MSGHSKWATIKHKKGAMDAKRGKLFSRLIKEITVSARMGGGDAEANPRLRTALLKAKAANMPKDTIERATTRGSGGGEGSDYTELHYEAYAPGGVGLLITALTDNKNRTAAEVRSILVRGGAQLASTGAVSYQFHKKGLIRYSQENVAFEALFEEALEAGAEDVSEEDGVVEVTTESSDFDRVLTHLHEKGYRETLEAEIAMVPKASVLLDGGKARKILELLEVLEDNVDVQSVASNLEIPSDFSLE